MIKRISMGIAAVAVALHPIASVAAAPPAALRDADAPHALIRTVDARFVRFVDGRVLPLAAGASVETWVEAPIGTAAWRGAVYKTYDGATGRTQAMRVVLWQPLSAGHVQELR